MATNSQPQETPEYRIFREHYDRLYHAIQDPLTLATQLFAKSIIASAIKGKMNIVGLSTLEKNNILLSAVEGQVQTDPRTFHVFLSTLNEDTSMKLLVESMQGKYLSALPHTDDEGRPTEFRETDEQDMTPAKRMCKRATKHGHHEHQERHGHCEDHQDLHGRHEHCQDCHGRHEHCQDHHGRHEHRQDCHGRHEHHQDRHNRHEHRQDRHGRHEHRHGRHEHHQDCHGRHEHHQDRHGRHEHRQDCCGRHEHRQDCHGRHEHRQDRHEHRRERHGHDDPRQSHHDHHEYCQSREHYDHHLPPTCRETPHQQPHYESHYQMPLESVYMYQLPHQHPSPCPSPPSMSKQHPQYYQSSSFRSPKLPLFQPPQTPFHPFCQAHSQAPVQPRYSFEPSYQPTAPSTSQSSPCPPPDSPRGKYAQFLRGYYTQHHAPCTKWPQLHTRSYINLAVISNDYANRADLIKFRQQTIHGSIDDVLGWKAPITMKNILKPNCVFDKYDDEKHKHYPVTQLLIEGAPGIGKSTFAWEICQKWGQHQLFNEYSLMVLLKFRDKRVQETKTVSELFYHPLPELQCDIIRDIVLSGGHGLLLILEGFDEAPASKRTMGSIFVRLFTGQELPKATVILTTRPSASEELRQICKSVNSRRIEIVGFGKKEIEEYIRCAFSDEQSQTDFNEYLSLYPHIHSMMYVPLNSVIVTHVYESCKSSGTVVPKTMTQLYSSLIRTLLLRYLKDKEEYKATCTNLNSFKDLPQPVYDQFCEICKIACTGIMGVETVLIFQGLPGDFDPLGLMQTCPELYVDRGASVSYNFLHLTVQEYLAAYHISQQSRDEQVAFMREHIKTMKLEVVLRFVAGLSELGRDLWDVVKGFASENNCIEIEILHWLFESHDPSVINSVLCSGCAHLHHEGSLPFDLYVLGYCITHSKCDWKLRLVRCEVESVQIFLRALNLCQKPPTGKIKELSLVDSRAAVHMLVDNLSQMLVFRNLIRLGLVECGLKSETYNLLSKRTNLLKHLECLDLSEDFYLSSGHAVNLIASLSTCTIRELNLYATCLDFEDCKSLSQLLTSSKYIKVLNVSVGCGPVYRELEGTAHGSIQLIVDSLSHNTSLEKLNMGGSNFSSVNVLSLASLLKVNTRLRHLYFKDCNIQSSDSVHLAKALEENATTQLQTLQLWDNPIGSEGAVAFADMLATNKSLTELNMRGCSIQEQGAICLAKALEKNFTVKKFDISENPIGSRGAVAFASMLTKNQCLKRLSLHADSVGVEGALELIESLKHNTTLEELKLSERCKPPSLDKALQDCVKFSQFL